MKNIQLIGDNNSIVDAPWAKGCVEACGNYCEDEELVILSIPAGSIITRVLGTGFNPTEEEVEVTVELGLNAIGHNIATYKWDGKDAFFPLEDPVVTVAPENVMVKLDKTLPKGSKICIFVEYISTIPAGDTVDIEPDLCNCDVDCETYKK